MTFLCKVGFALAAMCVAMGAQAQNSSKFHHLVSQKILDNKEFELRLKGENTNRILKLPKGKAVKAVVTGDKGVITMDVWQILTKDTQQPEKGLEKRWRRLIGRPRTVIPAGRDEFGTGVSAASDTLNAATPLAGYVLTLTDKRKQVGDPTRVLKLPFRAWTWGINTTPFRYRFARGAAANAVTSTLNFNLSGGITWGRTTFTSRLMRHRGNTIALFAGLGSADLKQSTVRDPVSWKARVTSFDVSDRSNATISYGLSYTHSLNNFGIVFSTGLESAVGPESEEWGYQHQPWVGIGVSTSLGFFK